MSFWDDVLALSPAVLWKLDEASGTVAADSSGNSRPGTYASGFTYAQPSIIPNEVSTCVSSVGNASIFVTRNSEAWMHPGANFTVMVTAQPSTVAVGDWRSLIGKQDCFQFWMMNGGRLQAHITPAWNSFLSSDNAAGKLVAGVPYLIFLRQDATAVKASIWINGVKVGEIAKSNALAASAGQLQALGAVAGGGRSFPGKQQGFAYWPGVALTDAQIIALYTKWATLASVAADPGPFTNPTISQIVDQGIVAAWGASADVGAEYELEYWNGSAWIPIIDELVNPSYSWDTSLVTENPTAKLRVQASFAGGISAWVESAEFQILHLTPPVWVTPTAIGGPYVDEVIADWSDSVSPDLGLAEYYEVQVWDGFSWFDLADVVLSGFTWDSHTRVGTGVKLRVRGILAVYTTAWVESEAFELLGGFALDYWRALLNDIGDIEGLWKGDWLTQGPGVGIDVSGNDRHGYVTMDMFNQPTIINNSNELSIGRNNPDLAGATDLGLNVTVDDPIWDITDFTMFIHFNIETANAADAIIAINSRVYARVNAAGTGLELWLQPTNNLIAAGSLPVVTDSYLVVTKKGDLITLYLDGVRIVDTSIVINVVGTGLFTFEGHSGTFQGVGYISRALDANEIKWLYNKSLEAPNLPPSDVGAFIEPLTVNGPYDHNMTIAWNPAVDPEADTLQYQIEYSFDNGATWALIFDWFTGDTKFWPMATVNATVTGKLRIRARDYPYEHVTAWVESEVFSINHPREGNAAPTVVVTWNGYDKVGLAVIPSISTGFGISHIVVESKFVTEDWSSGSVSSETVRERHYRFRFFHTLRGETDWIEPPTKLNVRVKVVDLGGNESPWVEFEHGRRWIIKHLTGGVIPAKDSSGNNRTGSYAGWSFGGGVTFASPTVPQLFRIPTNTMLKNPPRQNEPESQILAGIGWIKPPGNSIWIFHREDDPSLWAVDPVSDLRAPVFSVFFAVHLGAFMSSNYWSTGWSGGTNRRDFFMTAGWGLQIFVHKNSATIVGREADYEYEITGLNVNAKICAAIDFATGLDYSSIFSIPVPGTIKSSIDLTGKTLIVYWTHLQWRILTDNMPEVLFDFGAIDAEHKNFCLAITRDAIDSLDITFRWEDSNIIKTMSAVPEFPLHDNFTHIFNANAGTSGLGEDGMAGLPIELILWRDHALTSTEYASLKDAVNSVGSQTVPDVMATLPAPYWWYRFMDPEIPLKPSIIKAVFA